MFVYFQDEMPQNKKHTLQHNTLQLTSFSWTTLKIIQPRKSNFFSVLTDQNNKGKNQHR